MTDCDLFVERHQTPANGLRKEVHEVNPGAKYLADGLTHFCVRFQRDGDNVSRDKSTWAEGPDRSVCVHHGIHDIRWLEVTCWARDEQHVRERANEVYRAVNEADAWDTPGVFEPPEASVTNLKDKAMEKTRAKIRANFVRHGLIKKGGE